jgi:hypothetical protein
LPLNSFITALLAFLASKLTLAPPELNDLTSHIGLGAARTLAEQVITELGTVFRSSTRHKWIRFITALASFPPTPLLPEDGLVLEDLTSTDSDPSRTSFFFLHATTDQFGHPGLPIHTGPLHSLSSTFFLPVITTHALPDSSGRQSIAYMFTARDTTLV